MSIRLREITIALVMAMTCCLAAAATAQPPADLSLQGRLTDDVGDPLAGPVDLEVRVHGELVGGDPLYSERHPNLDVAEGGAFNVVVGTGSDRAGSLDADTFRGANRYLELVVDGDVLEPRQPLHSVPYALQATEAQRAAVAESVEGLDPEALDQSEHVARTDNPHGVSAEQIGAASSSEVTGAVAVHASQVSAHHAKTTSFREMRDEIADAQLPKGVARDAEILSLVTAVDGAGSGVDADRLDGLDASDFMAADEDRWVDSSGDSMSGSLDVTGRVTALQGFRYESAKTAFVGVAPSAWLPYSPTQRENWVSSPFGAYATQDAYGGSVTLSAPIQLPHGARIESLRCHFRDSAPSADVQFLASVFRKDYTASNVLTNVVLISHPEEVIQSDDALVESQDASGSSSVVDNDQYAYGLNLFWTVNGTNTSASTLSWHGCSVEYSTSEVLN